MVASETFLLALVFNLADGRGQRIQLDLAHQYFHFASGGVHIPKLSVLAGIVTLDERKLRVIRTPLDVLRTASGDAAFRED